MADPIMRDIDYAVMTLVCAIQREGFEEVRDCIADLPDDETIRGEPEPWQLALIEGIADAVRYAQAVRDGRSWHRVQFEPGQSVTWEWERGTPVTGAFRETVLRATEGLLDGRAIAEAPDTDHLTLRLASAPRRWRVGPEYGDCFEVDGDFDGITLAIELQHEAEGDAIARALAGMMPHWRGTVDV